MEGRKLSKLGYPVRGPSHRKGHWRVLRRPPYPNKNPKRTGHQLERKLTEEQVRWIKGVAHYDLRSRRAAGYKIRTKGLFSRLGDKFGVTPMCIWKIAYGYNWLHVSRPRWCDTDLTGKVPIGGKKPRSKKSRIAAMNAYWERRRAQSKGLTMQHMRALTLASAKHLLTQGHITPQHHARIVASVGAPKRKKPPITQGFGSLAGAQQAQAPIPGIGPSDPTMTPAGTASGY